MNSNTLYDQIMKQVKNLNPTSEAGYNSTGNFCINAQNIEKGASSWFRILIIPIIYIITFLEVFAIFYFIWIHFQEFNSRDITLVFTAILAQSFLIVRTVTVKLYSGIVEEKGEKE